MNRVLLFALLLLISGTAIGQVAADSNQVGNNTVIFIRKCEMQQPGIIWLHVHENESTAVAAAHAIIDSVEQGCFVTWQHSGDRYVSFELNGRKFRFDPNRIYTHKGLEATLKANGAYSKAGYKAAHKLATHFIKTYVEGNQLVIAMHNNTDNGGLHIKSYLPGGEYASDAAEVYVNDSTDIDDFFYTTDKRIFDFLKARGFNILLQNNQSVTDDGSLSVYCGYNGMAYLNIEAQSGHLEEQKRMMLAVYEMIGELFR